MKIKKYTIPDTHEKKSMIFLVPDLFGRTQSTVLLHPGPPRRRGQAGGESPGECLQVFVVLICFEKIQGRK